MSLDNLYLMLLAAFVAIMLVMWIGEHAYHAYQRHHVSRTTKVVDLTRLPSQSSMPGRSRRRHGNH